jgi:type IV pilus assembly protein PilO
MALEFNFDIDAQMERLAKVPKTVRLAVVSGFLVALAGAYWHFYYQPVQAERKEFMVRAQELQREVNNARAVASNIKAVEAEIEGMEQDLELALKQLPNRKQFEDLLQDISTAGKKVGVTIKTIERSAEVPRDFYAEVPFAAPHREHRQPRHPALEGDPGVDATQGGREGQDLPVPVQRGVIR